MSSISSRSGALGSEVSRGSGPPPHQRWLSQLKDNLDAAGSGQAPLQLGEKRPYEQERPTDQSIGSRADLGPNRLVASSDKPLAPKEMPRPREHILPDRGDSDSSDGRLAKLGDVELREELRMAEHERRVLAGEMEWKEVQWKTQLETLEINHWTALSELRTSKEWETAKMRRGFEDEIAALRAQLEMTQAQVSAMSKANEDVEESRQSASSGSQNSRAVPEMTPENRLGFLGGLRLRCPARRSDNVHALPSAMPGLGGAGDAVHCQGVIWEVVKRMPGITALLCSLPELEIQQATAEACKIWGSANLHGEGLLCLVTSPSRGASLQKAFNDPMPVGDVPGFCIKDVRCMEMTIQNGQNFDTSITAIRLPPEPALHKKAVGIVIIEPLKQVSLKKRREPDGHSVASGSSVSVSPSDSISCADHKNRNLHRSR